jgi:uncharacterized SAM-binding protein YcdF (DUF218 family)
MVVGACTLGLATWLVLGGSILLDRYLVLNDAPVKADAIICIAGGVGAHNLPTDEGWLRIYTAVQLQLDGYAPIVVFSGGGTEKVSEAEIYAEAALWLGLPAGSVVLDPVPGGTVDHPRNLQTLQQVRLKPDSNLLVVTSPFHTRRVSLCFQKAGFSRVRMISAYVAGRNDPRVVRDQRVSGVAGFRPSGKRYDDPFNRLKWGLGDLLTALRECAAIAVYKVRGQA